MQDYAENESLSTVAVSSMKFPARETDCGEVDTSVPGWRCPLKANGVSMYDQLVLNRASCLLTHVSQDRPGFDFQMQ